MADVSWRHPGGRWATVAGRVVVWVLLVIAATGAVRAWSAPTVVVPAGPAVELAAVDVSAAGLAEMLVAAWLGGETLDGLASDVPTAATSLTVKRTTTVAMAATEDGWTVTVAAEVAPPTAPDGATAVDVPAEMDRTDDDAEVRFYLVTVDAGPPPTVASLPAQVPVPARTNDPGTADVMEPLDALPDDVVDTLQGFAAGLLAGSGSLDRYLTTNSDIVAVDPPPFAAIELDAAVVVSADDTGAVLVVRVVGLAADGDAVHDLDYRLDLTRGDRWEVAAIS